MAKRNETKATDATATDATATDATATDATVLDAAQEADNAATDAAKDIAAHEAVSAAQDADNAAQEAEHDPMSDLLTIFLPTARNCKQTIIAAPHTSTGGLERWFPKDKLHGFTVHGKGKGVTIVIEARRLAYRDLYEMYAPQ